MAHKSIYADRSQVLTRCFATVKGPEDILLVPIDYAKKKHVARFCLGTGEYLDKDPIVIYNDLRGVAYLQRRIEGTCRRHGIAPEHVILGGEDVPSYALNFIERMSHMGCNVVRVNARQAKDKRTNSRATSDELALDGIAQMMLERRADDITVESGIHQELKPAARQRRCFVQEETACKNRIHRSVEILFPGFLGNRIDWTPYNSACLALLEDNFSVDRIKRKRHDPLVKLLRRHHITKAEKIVEQIKALAQQALPPSSACVAGESARLKNKVRLLRVVRDSLKDEEQRMAEILVQTPAFYITSVPGLGVVLSAHISAEIGPVETLRSADQIASYAGIIPRETQTGGPDNKPIKGHLPIDCNHVLKDYLIQAAFHTGISAHPIGHHPGYDGLHALQAHYQAVEKRDGKSRLSTAKNCIRVFRRLMLDRSIYVPQHWLEPTPAIESRELIDYYQSVCEALKRKWKPYNLSNVPEEKNELNNTLETLTQCCEHAEQFVGAAGNR